MCIRDRRYPRHQNRLVPEARRIATRLHLGHAFGTAAIAPADNARRVTPCLQLGGQPPVSYTHLDVYKRQLDVPALAISGAFNGQQARNAMAGHILAQASLTVTYSLNPAVPA